MPAEADLPQAVVALQGEGIPGAMDEARAPGGEAPPPLLRCPLCTGFATRSPPQYLVAHLTRCHAGHVLSEHACGVLCALDRGACTACGAWRTMVCRSCLRCQSTEPPRALVAGDRLPPPRPGRPGAAPQDPMPAALPAEAHANFLARVRNLPFTTILHMPVDQRIRHATVLANLLNRIAEGDADACVLEEARSRLLLGPVPRGTNVRMELARRLRLWADGQFMVLLVRAEEHCRHRARCRAALRAAPTHGARARRARALIGEGTYSKAASSLHTSVADLDGEAQAAWGAVLLPCSTRPAAARASRPLRQRHHQQTMPFMEGQPPL